MKMMAIGGIIMKKRTFSLLILFLFILTTLMCSYAVNWEEKLDGSKTQNTHNDAPAGYVETIVIENMVMEDNPGIAGITGFGYMGTLIAENKTYIIKLYQSDWNEIMRETNNNPIGKKINVLIEHDDFEEKWDGDNFYYIDSYYDRSGNQIA